MFQELPYRLRLRHNTSAWTSRGGAGHVAACLGRRRALLLRGPPRRVQRPHFRCFKKYI